MVKNGESGQKKPFSHYLPENKFFSYCPHLCLHMGNPLTPSLFLLTKMLSLGAVAMISTEREIVQAITTPFPHQCPDL